MKVRINGIGVIGGFGHGTETLIQAAIQQKPSISQPWHNRFGSNETALFTPELVADTALLSRFVTPTGLRRVDHYSRMAIFAAYLALQDAKQDAGMAGGLQVPIGLIVATGMGPTAGTLDSQTPDTDAADLRLSPIQFSNSVHNAAATYISILLKIRGPSVSINHFDMSVPLAFQTAMDWLKEGRAASVLVGGVDCYYKGINDAFLDTPGQKDGKNGRRPVPVGEGSAFFVLTLSGEKENRYPHLQDIRMGRCLQDMALPANALVLHNGSGHEAELIGPTTRQAVFSDVYGAFPSSMALDLAMASLLLKQGPGRSELLRHFDFGRFLSKIPQVCCLKKGAAGDWGLIDIE